MLHVPHGAAGRRSMPRGIGFVKLRSQRGIVSVDTHTTSRRLAIIVDVQTIVNHVLDVREG